MKYDGRCRRRRRCFFLQKCLTYFAPFRPFGALCTENIGKPFDLTKVVQKNNSLFAIDKGKVHPKRKGWLVAIVQPNLVTLFIMWVSSLGSFRPT